jgi:hypothetical protein
MRRRATMRPSWSVAWHMTWTRIATASRGGSKPLRAANKVKPCTALKRAGQVYTLPPKLVRSPSSGYSARAGSSIQPPLGCDAILGSRSPSVAVTAALSGAILTHSPRRRRIPMSSWFHRSQSPPRSRICSHFKRSHTSIFDNDLHHAPPRMCRRRQCEASPTRPSVAALLLQDRDRPCSQSDPFFK